MKLDRCFIYFSSILLLLILPFFAADGIYCNENYACTAASKFNIYLSASPETLKKKQCDDGCIYFFCVVENKTKVIFGAGCYSDYEKVCIDAPIEAKIDAKTINETPRIVAEVGHFFEVCTLDYCPFWDFDDTVSNNLNFFNTKFLDGIDQSYTEKCEYPPKLTIKPSTTLPSISDDQIDLTTVSTNKKLINLTTVSTNGGLMNQMNGFHFIVLGFIYALFW